MKRPKYNARKTVVNGITFDSRKEALRYAELLEMQDSGVISDLSRQVKFVLIDAQREPDSIGPKGGVIHGKTIEREAAYIADFTYRDGKGTLVVEDTKGVRTPDYVLKRKLMLERFGIRIKEV